MRRPGPVSTAARALTAAGVTATLVVLGAGTATLPAQAAGGRTLFVGSAVENGDGTVTLPVHPGRAGGQRFWYVVLDASTSGLAERFGAIRANKLANAGPGATQPGHFEDGELVVPGGVDFRPTRDVGTATPGSVGDARYSPLVRLPGGAVLDAPHVANATGRHDKVVSLDTSARTVTLVETEGRARGTVVHYVSTDASKPLPAALEGATLAPRLDAAPAPGGDGTDSSRASLAAFTNGRTGADNPERQGIGSALADGLDPLNLLAWLPNQGRYSPLWDVHLSEWTAAAKAGGRDLRQDEFAHVEDLVRAGLVTGPDGGVWGPSDAVVICPVISRE